MDAKMLEAVEAALKAWHDAGRAEHEARFSSLSYDRYENKHFREGKKYVNLDIGTSGAYIVDKETGDVFNIKGYGQIDRRKKIGNIYSVTGETLYRMRWNCLTGDGHEG